MTDTLLAHVYETSSADSATRPQDDFYRHANGAWIDAHEIPADRPIDGAFHALRDLSQDRERAIAEDAVAGRLDDEDARIIAVLYSQFMDEDAIEALGASPLLPDLDAIDAAPDAAALAAVSGRLMREGVGGVFGAYVGTDPHDSTRHMVSIVQSGIGLPDEAYYREEQYAPIRDAYVAHVARLLDLAGAADPDGAEATARRIMDLETRIASHHRDAVANRDPLACDNPTAWTDLVADHPGFDWGAWAREIRLPVVPGLVVNIDQPDFLQAACRLWSDADLADLKAWMRAALIDARASLLSSEFVEENFDFHGRALAGTQELRPRWKRALGLVDSVAGESVGRIWVARHFPPAAKERMDALVSRLLDAYAASIKGLDWMGEETRSRALGKLATFNPKIGYPKKWEPLDGLEVGADRTLVENLRAACAFSTDREWRKLAREVDRDEWLMTPQTVNAYYNPTLNEIVFPAAILQPPFFDPEADDAVNFGAIGAVIGHEIGHGFDDQGSRFDAEGNLENWWDDEDRARFEERTRALIDQYGALTPADLVGADAEGEPLPADSDEPPAEHLVNGALTIGENIGDLGGLAIAWKAWAAALAEEGLTPDTAPVIDGLTGPQRFFYSWARIWRTASRPRFAVQMLAIDPHSPAEFRCNQVLKNLDAFHEAFAVRPGDGMWMDPAERIAIW
ncbi:peptidase M13 [Actinomyces sp. B33]|uniref:M13 family metallopeptidase n=1 Tax=Actinomyces sp. B33 TaxID=2942131 RepID=UPI0023418755|nr:M13-type metalloendopeptidase [Actinomyces sp. B33]MDC4233146.1 peptidase M13 [Actinomyces sp. B33]